jgi:hypothetical protein
MSLALPLYIRHDQVPFKEIVHLEAWQRNYANAGT